MELETNNETVEQEVEEKNSLHTVTPLSKYLAMALFIILPFLGGWIGYTYAPEKIVEVEKVIIKETESVQNYEDESTSEEEMFTCEFDVVYEVDECWCHEGAIENVYQLDGKDVLFCASEGLDKEVLDRIDILPNETIPADEVILPNGMSLDEYSRMRGIETATFERVGNTNYYKDTKNVYVFNEGDIYTESGLVETGGIPSECAESNLDGCVPEEIGRCQTWMMGGASYGKNERGVFVIYNNNSVELLDIDKNSFRYLEFIENYSTDSRGMGGTGFAVDNNNVYVGCGDILEDESPGTFNLESYLETNNTAQ